MAVTGDIIFYFSDTSIKHKLIKSFVKDPIHIGIAIFTSELKILHSSKEKRKVVLEPLKESQRNCKIAFFRLKKQFLKKLDKEKLIHAAFDLIGKNYGFRTWLTLALSTFLKLPPEAFGHGDFSDYAPHCSALVSRVYRLAGVDLREDLPDVLTTPFDIFVSDKIEPI